MFMNMASPGAPLDPLLKRHIDAANERRAHTIHLEPAQSLLSQFSHRVITFIAWLAFFIYFIYQVGNSFTYLVAEYPNAPLVMYVWWLFGYLTHGYIFVFYFLFSGVITLFLYALRKLTRKNWQSALAVGCITFVLIGLPMGLFFGNLESAVPSFMLALLVLSLYLLMAGQDWRPPGHVLPIVIPALFFLGFWAIAVIDNEFGTDGENSLYWFIFGYVPVFVIALPAVVVVSALYFFVRLVWKKRGWRTLIMPISIKLLVGAILTGMLTIILRTSISEGMFFFIPLPGILLAYFSVITTDRLANRWQIGLPLAWREYISPSARWVLPIIVLAMFGGLVQS